MLTPLARQGIFRFYPGVNNGNFDTTPSGTGNTRVVPVVDRAGNPLDFTQISGAPGQCEVSAFTVTRRILAILSARESIRRDS